MTTTQIISPIDGSVYAERALTSDAALDAALSRARAAQADWARVPLLDRATACLAFLDALVACATAARSAASKNASAT